MSKKIGFIPLIMIFLLLVFPDLSHEGARRGVMLWSEHILPTLFPFMAVSMMLRLSGALGKLHFIAKPISKFLRMPESAFDAVISGLVSGCPVGAGITASLAENGKIKPEDASYVATLSSFCSPVFVISTVGAKLMGSAKIGLMVLGIHYASWIVAVLLLRRKKYTSEMHSLNDKMEVPSPGNILKASVESAVKTILIVGGYIVLFSVMTEFISNLGLFPKSEIARLIISALLELSGGCRDIALSGLDIRLILPLLCFAVTWSGACIFLQVNGFVNEYGGGSFYIKFKCVQALVALVLGWCGALF